MPIVHPFGVAALLLAGTLLSACGTGTPASTRVTAVANPPPGATSAPSGTAESGGDHSGQQSGQQSGRQLSGAAVPGTPPTTPTTRSTVDVIEVSKCYTNATASNGGQLLIKARSSDPSARLLAYRPDGALIGQVQNGGSSRYGGTVIAYQPHDPVRVTVRSSAGGTTTVPTTPFQPDN